MTADRITANVDPTEPTTAHIFIPGRPSLINVKRSGNWRARADQVRTERHLGHLAGNRLRNQRYEFPTPASIISTPLYKNRRSWPDVGNWAVATKAIIDGLVDAGAWHDDTHNYISFIGHTAPRISPNHGPGIVITITPGPAIETQPYEQAI